jgi:hypothetical protein
MQNIKKRKNDLLIRILVVHLQPFRKEVTQISSTTADDEQYLTSRT